MAAVLEMSRSTLAPLEVASADGAPIVVVGCGPVGMRVTEELARLNSNRNILQFGAEAVEPYNRVRLSSFLAGEIDYESLTDASALPLSGNIERRLGCAIASIDREQRFVTDSRGDKHYYSDLVLAVGSTPHVPNVANIRLDGVFTFRDFDDAQQLFARRARSRRTVVLGAGLLGLEAARAMRRFNTEVVVIEHAPRPLPRLLDECAGKMLRRHMEGTGIRMLLGVTVKSLQGEGRVTAVQLVGGERVECDTVIVATGIRPNIELARCAGIVVGRGIRVDDSLRTSDPHIYAVGECVEHRDVVYGLVGPGIEQASIAAAVISGKPATYRGSTLATKLKVVGLSVFAVGRVVEDDLHRDARQVVYGDEASDSYRKIIIERGRLVGAIAIDSTPEMARLQEAVIQQRRVWPWRQWRFTRTGCVWPESEAESVVQWPAEVAVCQCTGVTRGQLGSAIAGGCQTVAALSARTGAATVCGTCRPLLTELLGGAVREPVRGARWLSATAVIACIAAALMLVAPAIPYTKLVSAAWHWDVIWRNTFYKQVSGYVILAMSVVAAFLSMRKRIRRFTLGDFAGWRVVHAMIGVIAVAALLVHTGARLGANLDRYLMLSFLGLIAIGAGSAAIVAFEHRMARQSLLGVSRRRWVWLHIVCGWPLPVLLGWHVFKSYYF